MAILHIPESDRYGLTLIRDLSADQFSQLLIELDRQPTTTPFIEGLEPQKAERIRTALNSMYRTRLYADVSIEEFVNDTMDALRELRVAVPDESRLHERLVRILDIEPLTFVNKATLLRLEYEHRFCSARVLTDVRPVFADPKSAPTAMIIGHTLRLTYHEGSSAAKEIYVALAPSDLEELTTALQRAKEKEASLRSALESTKIEVLEGKAE